MNFNVIKRAQQILMDSDLDAVTKILAGLILKAFAPDASSDAVNKLVKTHSAEQLEAASSMVETAIYEAKRDREDYILVNGSAAEIEMLNLEYENMQKQLEKTIAKIELKFNKNEENQPLENNQESFDNAQSEQHTP